MPTKGNPKIRITDAAYKRLQSFKQDGETNAEAMERLTNILTSKAQDVATQAGKEAWASWKEQNKT